MNDEIGGRYDRYSQQDYRSKSIEDELKKRRVRFEGEDSIEKDAPSFSSASVLKASINNTESFLHKSTTNTTATVATNTDVHVVGNQYLSNSRGFTTSPTSNQPSFPANAVPPVNHHDHQDPQQYEDTFSRFSSQVHQAAQRLEDIATPRTNHRRTGTITEEKFEEMRSSMDNNNHEIGNNAVLNSQLLEPYLIGGTSASLSFVAESNHYPPESSSTSPSHIRSYPCQPAGSPIDNQAVLQHAAIFAGTSDRSPSIMASNSSSRSDSKPSSTPPVFKSSTPPHHQTLNPSKTQQPQQQQSPHARLHTPESASVEHSDIDRIFARVAASALRNQDQLTSKANNNQKNSNSPLKPSSVKSTPSPQKTQHQQPRSSSTYNVEAHISVNTQNLGDVTDQIVPPSSAPPKFVAAAPVSLHSSLYKTTSSCSKNTSPVSSTSNIKSNINHHHSVHEHPLPHLLYNQQPSSFDGGEMKLEEIMIEGEEDNEHIAKANLTALLRHGSSHGKFVLVGESAKIDLQTVSARHFSFGFDEVITPDHSRPASQQPLRGIGVPVSALFSTENDGFSSSASNILMDRAVGGDRSVWRKDAVVCEKVVGGEEDGDVVVSAMDETTAPSISAIERGGVGLDGDDDIEEDDDGSIFKIGNKAANSTMLTGSFAAVSENNLVSRSNNKNILHDANTGTGEKAANVFRNFTN